MVCYYSYNKFKNTIEEASAKGASEEIKQRDINDSTRAASPLKQAEDAILFDTSDLTETEAVESMLKHIYSILN